MRWHEVEADFEADGSLRDIYVLETTALDQDRFLAALAGWGYGLSYTEDGEAATMPAGFAAFAARMKVAAVRLAIDLGEVVVHFHPFDASEIELDIDPRQVRGEPELAEVCGLMRRLGQCLGREVRLTPESSPKSAIFIYQPADDNFTFYPP